MVTVAGRWLLEGSRLLCYRGAALRQFATSRLQQRAALLQRWWVVGAEHRASRLPRAGHLFPSLRACLSCLSLSSQWPILHHRWGRQKGETTAHLLFGETRSVQLSERRGRQGRERERERKEGTAQETCHLHEKCLVRMKLCSGFDANKVVPPEVGFFFWVQRKTGGCSVVHLSSNRTTQEGKFLITSTLTMNPSLRDFHVAMAKVQLTGVCMCGSQTRIFLPQENN